MRSRRFDKWPFEMKGSRLLALSREAGLTPAAHEPPNAELQTNVNQERWALEAERKAREARLDQQGRAGAESRTEAEAQKISPHAVLSPIRQPRNSGVDTADGPGETGLEHGAKSEPRRTSASCKEPRGGGKGGTRKTSFTSGKPARRASYLKAKRQRERAAEKERQQIAARNSTEVATAVESRADNQQPEAALIINNHAIPNWACSVTKLGRYEASLQLLDLANWVRITLEAERLARRIRRKKQRLILAENGQPLGHMDEHWERTGGASGVLR
jgi:hypothetical protein